MIPDSWGAARGREPGFPPLSRKGHDTVETVINRSDSGNCWTKNRRERFSTSLPAAARRVPAMDGGHKKLAARGLRMVNSPPIVKGSLILCARPSMAGTLRAVASDVKNRSRRFFVLRRPRRAPFGPSRERRQKNAPGNFKGHSKPSQSRIAKAHSGDGFECPASGNKDCYGTGEASWNQVMGASNLSGDPRRQQGHDDTVSP